MASQITAKKQQELQNQYSAYKNGLQQIAQKIGDVEQEAEEHNRQTTRLRVEKDVGRLLEYPANISRLVLETLTPLPGDRKCFRMINGVLIERTVEDVVPALKTNSEGLGKVLEDLVKSYKRQQEEMEKWKKKNNIQVVQQ